MNRRDFIHIIAVSAAGVMLPIQCMPAASDEESRASDEKKTILEPATMVTPNKQFFVTSIGRIPAVDIKNWRLLLTGKVERVTIFTYDDILKMKPMTKMLTLTCIGDDIGGKLIGNAMWTGVSMREVLDRAGIQKGVKKLIFRCADGYSTGVPLKDALHKDAMLAYKMNDDVLPQEHGYPLRFLNPGHYGMKNPKSIVNIELTDKDYQGYSEKLGWDDVARIKLKSSIGIPKRKETITTQTYTISGFAFDGGNHKGIAKVEVSTDDGKNWHEAEIWARHSPLTWSLWKYTWQVPETTERIFLKARAITNDGTIQSSTNVDAFPAGASGIHTVEV